MLLSSFPMGRDSPGRDVLGRREPKGLVVSQSSVHQEIAVEGFVGCAGLS